jgi:alcohol dehydrogenase (cytochrome c)
MASANRPTRWWSVSVVAALVVTVVTVAPAGGGSPECGVTPPPEVAANVDGWPLPNRDYANGRAQLESRIDASTVDELARVWEYAVPGTTLFGNLTTTPVVVDDTVYVGALDGSMHAIDLEDGQQRWAVPRTLSQFGPSGVAVGWDKVFGLSGAATVSANDADTGDPVWTTNLTQAPGNQIDVAPMVIGGCVLVASQGLAPGSRGTLFALDQATGDVWWSFETVPDDFWGNPRVNHGGGSWYPPTVDAATGRVWWGTSNPWPAPGSSGFPAGSSRPGDNLYTNSALALDLADGSLAWHDQAFAHDIWDRDMVLTQLVDTDGGAVLVHTGKGGVVRGLDPDTGDLQWSTEVGMHLNDDVTEFVGPLTVMPGVLGGVETPPAAADGVVYLSVLNAPSTYSGPEQTFNLNAQLGSFPSDLVAIDARNGDVLYEVDIPGDGLGGVTVVNDLLFTSTFGGLLLAYDRATGAEVWRHQADGFVNGSPAVVGDTILWPVSGANPAEVVAFRIPAQPPPTTTTTVSPPTAPPSTGSITSTTGTTIAPSTGARDTGGRLVPVDPLRASPGFTG